MCIIVAKEVGADLPSEEILRECFRCNKDGFGMAWRKAGDDKVNIWKGGMDIDTALDMIDSVPQPKKHAMILHFRIATEGRVFPGNCHPYPITPSVRELHKTRITTDIAFAHNGVLSRLGGNEEYKAPEKPVVTSLALSSNAVVDTAGVVLGHWEHSHFVGNLARQPHFHGGSTYPCYCNWPLGTASTTTTTYKSGLQMKYTDSLIFVRDFLAPCKSIVLSKPFQRLLNTFVYSKLAFLSPTGLYLTGNFSIEDNGVHYSNYSYRPTVSYSSTKSNDKTDDKKDSKITTSTREVSTIDPPKRYVACDLCDTFHPVNELITQEDLLACPDCIAEICTAGYSCTAKQGGGA